MSKVFLVSCAREKQKESAPAGDLYTSSWFQKARAYARTNADRWYILSALHGLVRPTELIAPYEKTLNNMPVAERRLWGQKVFESLNSVLEPGDDITVLAGTKYREFLVPALQKKGFKPKIPLQGISIGKQLSWLKKRQGLPKDSWAADLDRFYSLLHRLERGIGSRRLLSACTGRDEWPRRGVYFFFEPNEYRRADAKVARVVRVGTHAVSAGSKSNLWTRLRTHRGHDDGTGNHRGSIFRLHVGAALQAASSAKGSIVSWGVGQSASSRIRDDEVALEMLVSKHIGAMSILWLAIDDDASPGSDRAFIERHSIGLLSRHLSPIDSPSDSWLGKYSPSIEIKKSGLWNLNYLANGYDPAFLDVMADYVEVTLGKLSMPSTPIAPKDWRVSPTRKSADSQQMDLFPGTN